MLRPLAQNGKLFGGPVVPLTLVVLGPKGLSWKGLGDTCKLLCSLECCTQLNHIMSLRAHGP